MSELEPRPPAPRVRGRIIRLLRGVAPVRRAALAIVQPELKRERRRARAGTDWSAPDAIELRGGRLLGSVGGSLPIVAILATGLESGAERELAREVEAASFLRGGYRALVIMDGSDFRSFRERRIPVERVLRESDFAEVSPWGNYEGYLARRVADIVASYGALAAVPADRHPDGTWGLRRLHVSGEVRPRRKPTTGTVVANMSPL